MSAQKMSSNFKYVMVTDFSDQTSQDQLFRMLDEVVRVMVMEFIKSETTNERMAVVTVTSKDDARHLVNKFNFFEVRPGEILRVSTCKRTGDVSTDHATVNRQNDVFIRDLPVNVARKDLYTLFPKSTIVNCRVSDVRPGHAYIQFKTSQQAENAKNMNGTLFRGRNIIVSKYLPTQEFAANNLRITNFGDFFTTNESLRQKFSNFGRIVDAALKGPVGFVAFECHDDALEAQKKLHREVLTNGRSLHVSFQRDFQSNSEGKNIIINSLPDTVCEDRLRELFSRFGKILDVTVGYRKGFVNFEAKEVADTAVREMDCQMVYGSRVRVNIVQKTRATVTPFADMTNQMRYNRSAF